MGFDGGKVTVRESRNTGRGQVVNGNNYVTNHKPSKNKIRVRVAVGPFSGEFSYQWSCVCSLPNDVFICDVVS